MAYWGAFTWGDGTVWGDLEYGLYPRIAYGLCIDWDGDGLFTGENDALLMESWSIDRGREFFLNSSGDGMEPVNEGKLSLTLDNTDGRYDPYQHPEILPGRKVWFYVRNLSTLVDYDLFTGEIDDIRPFAREETVQITCVDAMRRLKGTSTTLALNADIKVSDAVAAILTSAGYTDQDIDSQLDIIPYWWVNQQIVTTAIQELCDASLGTFYLAADGTAKFQARQRVITSVLTLTQAEFLKDISVRQPWDVVRNNIDVMVNTLVQQTTGAIWTLRDKPTVAAGGTLEIWGTFSYLNKSCPATGVVSPVATTDYTMNTAADGTGTNLTASFTVTADIFGESVKLTIANGSGSIGYITLLKIRGDALFASDPVRINTIDTASVAIYHNRGFKLDSQWLQNTNSAVDMADIIKGLLASARKYPTVRVDTRPEIQFEADLFDRLSVSIAALGIDHPFRIGSIKHESTSPTCQSVVTTWILEPVTATADTYWIFTTLIGQTSNFS